MHQPIMQWLPPLPHARPPPAPWHKTVCSSNYRVFFQMKMEYEYGIAHGIAEWNTLKHGITGPRKNSKWNTPAIPGQMSAIPGLGPVFQIHHHALFQDSTWNSVCIP